MAERSAAAASLWGKTSKYSEDWLPLLQHMRDSAECATRLFDHYLAPGLAHQIAHQLSVTTRELRALKSFLAAVHDAGKAEHGFQTSIQRSERHSYLADAIYAHGLKAPAWSRTKKVPHSHLSFVLLRNYLRQELSLSRSAAITWAAIVGGHHGVPTFSTDVTDAQEVIDLQHPSWTTVQYELLHEAAEFTHVKPVFAKLQKINLPVSAQSVITGLVIMADWIASNEDLFPMQSVIDETTSRADQAWKRLELPPGWTISDQANLQPADLYRQRFTWPKHRQPFAAQTLAVEVARSLSGPAILVVEAPMGQGKTELALAAAEQLAKSSGRRGLMFAAPTMATSDSLFNRVSAWAKHSQASDNVASVYLGHSKNYLNQSFFNMPRRASLNLEQDEESNSAEVIAHDWLHGRKKGVLSDFVVGTVDQVLFAALKTKHLMLRHLGLAQKVVIIDEVHAYDEYMSSYLEKTLMWLAELGVPVILLSATLPEAVKTKLLRAYSSGAGFAPDSIAPTQKSYPLLTALSGTGFNEHSVPQPDSYASVDIEYIPDDTSQIAAVLQPLASTGGCAVVVCSTIARAQAAYRAACDAFGSDTTVLLHSALVSQDRVSRERQLTTELGPKARRGSGRPEKRIVVATQVIEQSLDLDFDVMISDIAPTDLLLQRMGRVHRHRRPSTDRGEAFQEPKAYLRGVTSQGSSEEPPRFDGGVESIYDAYMLMKSTAVIDAHKKSGSISLPGDIPTLVAQMYGDDEPVVPETWWPQLQAARTKHEDKVRLKQIRAKTYQLPSPSLQRRTLADIFELATVDFEQSGATGEAMGNAQVRDIEPTIEAIVIQRYNNGYRLLPWIDSRYETCELFSDMPPDLSIAQLLATCTVRLPRQFSKEWRIKEVIEELEASTPPGWSDSFLLRTQIALVLDDDFNAEVNGGTLHYDRELGLVAVTRPCSSPAGEET